MNPDLKRQDEEIQSKITDIDIKYEKKKTKYNLDLLEEEVSNLNILLSALNQDLESTFGGDWA